MSTWPAPLHQRLLAPKKPADRRYQGSHGPQPSNVADTAGPVVAAADATPRIAPRRILSSARGRHLHPQHPDSPSASTSVPTWNEGAAAEAVGAVATHRRRSRLADGKSYFEACGLSKGMAPQMLSPPRGTDVAFGPHAVAVASAAADDVPLAWPSLGARTVHFNSSRFPLNRSIWSPVWLVPVTAPAPGHGPGRRNQRLFA